jgi:glycerophosphoryl diester phosphodiesterase
VTSARGATEFGGELSQRALAVASAGVTEVWAHRGANREEPENTVAAFARALELGADGVELDVQRSADDGLVVCHDAVTAAGPVAELTTAELLAAVPGMPTLADALDACSGRRVDVEIKNMPYLPGFDPDDRVADLLVALLRSRGGRDRVLVSSFRLESVDRVLAAAPEVETGLLAMGDEPLVVLGWAADRGHRAFHPSLSMLDGQVLDEVVARAHDRGVAVNVWTVNEEADLRRLRDAGVDAVISDDPAVARSVCAASPP